MNQYKKGTGAVMELDLTEMSDQRSPTVPSPNALATNQTQKKRLLSIHPKVFAPQFISMEKNISALPPNDDHFWFKHLKILFVHALQESNTFKPKISILFLMRRNSNLILVIWKEVWVSKLFPFLDKVPISPFFSAS